MIGQQDTQQPAALVEECVSETRSNLPVDMLPLPSALTDQNHSHGRFPNESIADVLPNRLGVETLVVYVTILDRLVDNVALHHADEKVLWGLTDLLDNYWSDSQIRGD